MRREFSIAGEQYSLYRSRGRKKVVLWSEGFNASVSQLETLSKRASGKTVRDIAAEEGVSVEAINLRLRELAKTNPAIPRTEVNIEPLIAEAERRELLYPISIIGLRAMADELINSA